MSTYLTKREMVYADIKSKILSGILKPGDRLHIRLIAKEYGISEIPVREAIQSLEHDKLAHVVPHTGAIVAPLSEKDLNEILELRIYMESLATFLATPHITEKTISDLENIVFQQEYLFSKGDVNHDFGLLNTSFHEMIYQCNPNNRLKSIVFHLRENTQRYHMFFTLYKEFSKGSIEDHKNILQAIKERDAEKARLNMQKHKERAAKQILLDWKDNVS